VTIIAFEETFEAGVLIGNLIVLYLSY